MDYFVIAGKYLDGFHITSLRYWNRNYEIAKHVSSARLKSVRGRKFDHQVGLAKLPRVVELRRRHQVRNSAFGGALLYPTLNDFDLIVGESALAGEITITRLG